MSNDNDILERLKAYSYDQEKIIIDARDEVSRLRSEIATLRRGPTCRHCKKAIEGDCMVAGGFCSAKCDLRFKLTENLYDAIQEWAAGEDWETRTIKRLREVLYENGFCGEGPGLPGLIEHAIKESANNARQESAEEHRKISNALQRCWYELPDNEEGHVYEAIRRLRVRAEAADTTGDTDDCEPRRGAVVDEIATWIETDPDATSQPGNSLDSPNEWREPLSRKEIGARLRKKFG